MKKNLATKYCAVLLCIATYGCNNMWKPTHPSSSKLDDLYQGQSAESWAKTKSKTSPVRGWEYVIERLEKKGVPLATLSEIYSSPQLPYWTPITFKVRPKEGHTMYRELASKVAQKNARDFLELNKSYFQGAEKKYLVPKEIIVSILQVETQCGKNTGTESVLYWLSRLVSAGFPPNVEYNYANSQENPKPSLKELEERASWLEEEFMPHLIAVIEISKSSGESPFDIKGSKGGAIGMTQFLPKNVEKFGVDGDNNGSINLFTPADAIYSVANFLSQHGWQGKLSEKEKTKVLLEYNRSSAYAETVLNLASSLK